MKQEDKIQIKPAGPIDGEVTVPGSRSMTNRMLLLAALADGEVRLLDPLESEDTLRMKEGLRALGFRVDETEGAIIIEGRGGEIPASEAELNGGDSGTATRFLTALSTLGKGEYRIDGSERMRQRPIGDLLEGLNALGSNATSLAFSRDYPPVRVDASGLQGGKISLRGDKSSQYLSAILMVSPCARENVEIEIAGRLASRPYVRMTLAAMRQFGVNAVNDDFRRFRVEAGQRYQPREVAIEGDWSSAVYFLCAAAATGGRVRVDNVHPSSVQADSGIVAILEQMGCSSNQGENWIEVTGPGKLNGIEVDMNPMPDAAVALAVLALFAEGETIIRGISNLRIKESDRIAALHAELTKLGGEVTELPDGLKIRAADLHGAEIDTYNDHRIAMSFAVAGLCIPGVTIKDPGCVAKTFPHFFEELSRLTTGA